MTQRRNGLFLGLTVLLIFLSTCEGVNADQERTYLNESELSLLRKDFDQIDRNGDGYVDAHEIRLSFPGISEDDISSVFDSYDDDRDGVLSFEEFINIRRSDQQDRDNETR